MCTLTTTLYFPRKIPAWEHNGHPGNFLFTIYDSGRVNKMENGMTIRKNFGIVACGQKNIDTVKIENTSKKVRVLVVDWRGGKSEVENQRLHIHPHQAVAQPGQAARFTLTYLSHLEDIVDNFYYNILENEKLVARLNVHAESSGPCLNPLVHNLRFFSFRTVSQTVKRVEIVNTAKCEAKFYFDLDEDYPHLEISQTRGVIPSGLKLGLKFTFKPLEPGVYYKKIFCIVQFHKPIIFNILGMCKPKLRLEPKALKFRFPPEKRFPNNYEAYMARMIPVKLPEGEKAPLFFKCAEEHEMRANERVEEPESVKKCWSVPLDTVPQPENQQSSDNPATEVNLTTRYIDIKNSPEVLKATTLINLSATQLYYYEWDHDPKDHFRINPCKGFLEPNTRTHFSIYFTPSTLDLLYHAEVDLKVFPCNDEAEKGSSVQVVDLPLTMSLRINGHSFPDDSCGWVPQCKITQKTLHLRPCVPDETVYGTFMIERQGHLPVTFTVLPPKDQNYTVQPPLGYLSKSFQLFVVQFSSESKEEGVYMENLKIVFNNSNTGPNSNSNCERIKLVTSVEIPKLIFGKDNSLTFTTIFPGSRTSAFVPIENPTNLHISYEFVTPDDVTWTEVVNPKGLVGPKSFGEVEVVFKPETPCEYLDYIPCYISSTSKPDRTETIHLQLIGSCQFGYLVATPSIHDFGESIYLEEKSIKVHLFNFSPSLLHFRLTTVHRAFPVGDPENDLRITPNRGSVPAGGSLEVEVTITPHNIDIIQYAILCQNLEDDSEEASPCEEEPRKIILLRFEGVMPAIQILDVSVIGGGPLISPHWMWKLINIDRMNKALKSLSPYEEVEINFPETAVKSNPVTILLLVQNNRHGEIMWRVRQEIFCPCLQASETEMERNPSCNHPTEANFSPVERRLGASQRLILEITVKYEIFKDRVFQWTLEMPHGKTVVFKTSSWRKSPAFLSMYTRTNFPLRPVFIGDPHPPLQLVWLCNNTNETSSYVVDKVALQEAPANVPVLDCINPKGVIPPFSVLPLKFMFEPKEIKHYSAEVLIYLNNRKLVLYLSGEGIPNPRQFQELSIPTTIPKRSFLLNMESDLECSENFVEIPFFRVFSRIERIFFLRNRSDSEAWSFRWHSFNAQDIISANVVPAEGVINPGQSAMMTLVIKSFAYPTFVSISIPCDIINYSQLKAYESSVRYRETMIEKAKDYFTITEKGISFEEPDIPIKEKPNPAHIFITLNANIVSSLNIDQKISQKQQSILQAENEITHRCGAETPPTPSSLPAIQQVLENLLWKVLVSNNVRESIEKLQTAQDYNYLQILPESKRKSEDITKRFFKVPSKNQVQRVLENEMKEILRKKCSTMINDQPE